jgi:hypothetical protein
MMKEFLPGLLSRKTMLFRVSLINVVFASIVNYQIRVGIRLTFLAGQGYARILPLACFCLIIFDATTCCLVSNTAGLTNSWLVKDKISC